MESPAIMGEAGDIICKEKTKKSGDDVCVNGSINCDEPMEVCTENSKALAASEDSSQNHEKVPEVELPTDDESDNEIEAMEVDTTSPIEEEHEEDSNIDKDEDLVDLSETEENESLTKALSNGTDNSFNDDVIELDEAIADASEEQDLELNKNDKSVELNDSGDVVVIETDSERKENGDTCSSPDVEEVINISDKDIANSSAETVNLLTPMKKKIRKSSELFGPPRRSSRNLHKQKSYIEKEDEDPDVEEVTPQDPLADPLRDDKENNKKVKQSTPHTGSTIVVSDTKRLVEIAANSKVSNSSGKKEPTLVIIDTNSILSGRGPVPVSHKPASITTSFSMMPVALPAQGVYPPNMRATITPIPMASVQPKPTPPPTPILPTLTDDMFVVEAPSFIVPYVYEKPPIKPFKEFVTQMGKEILDERKREQEREEKEKCEKDKEDKIVKEDREEKSDKLDEKPKIENKMDETKEDVEIKEDEDDAVDNEDETRKQANGDKVDKEIEDKVDKKTENKDEQSESVMGKDEAMVESDCEDVNSSKPEDVKDGEQSAEKKKDDVEVINLKDDSLKTIDLDELPDESVTPVKPKSNSYFDNALGQFFINIGFNLVQEFVQTDLLKQQKRKNSREGNTSMNTKIAISSLIKNLEYSKENNEPFKMEQKKCEFCSFKTESSLALAHHLETPHMRNYVYKCNFCPLEVRSPHDILFHMEAEHNTRGRLERAPAFHQCPNCSFEDNQKGKLSRHLVTCLKKFKPERNMEPPLEWEPPAKIPRVPRMKQTGLSATGAMYQAIAQSKGNYQLFSKLQAQSASPVFPRGRGRPSLMGKVNSIRTNTPPIIRNMIYRPSTSGGSVLVPTSYQLSGNQIFQVVGGQTELAAAGRLTGCPSTAPVALLPSMASASSTVTIQNSSGKSSSGKVVQQPSISITPLPRQPSSSATITKTSGPSGGDSSSSKATFVICEICDGYIKDLEQLRNHMQWIHKVKIHPKMIYNRPPLNCQKCQFRFFTDQGLERHLLGSHGLVTSSMQEAANKSKDAGRCPVCGRVYQWKLLNHVARDHNMTLKPAHLSYKCTVCTATFGMYKQFENHVYSAHSVVAKRVMEKKGPSSPASGRPTSDSLLKPLKINDEITIIPQPAKPKTNSAGVGRSTGGSSGDRGK